MPPHRPDTLKQHRPAAGGVKRGRIRVRQGFITHQPLFSLSDDTLTMHTHARGGVPSRPPETAPCYVPAGYDPGTTLQQSDGMRTPARFATHAFLFPPLPSSPP